MSAWAFKSGDLADALVRLRKDRIYVEVVEEVEAEPDGTVTIAKHFEITGARAENGAIILSIGDDIEE